MKISHLGTVPYLEIYQKMQDFTSQRSTDTQDELWLCEHPPVYTLGLSAASPDLLGPSSIPIVPTNRGGKITYHGPGQVVAYPLINLKDKGYFVKEYVYRLEEAVIKTLNSLNLTAHRVLGAPGVYVNALDPRAHDTRSTTRAERAMNSPTRAPAFDGLSKISAIGVKVSKHCTYHGLSLNVSLDLSPFEAINPCGYEGLKTTHLHHLGVMLNCQDVAFLLAEKLNTYLLSLIHI